MFTMTMCLSRVDYHPGWRLCQLKRFLIAPKCICMAELWCGCYIGILEYFPGAQTVHSHLYDCRVPSSSAHARSRRCSHI